jgi:hypothetical protein
LTQQLRLVYSRKETGSGISSVKCEMLPVGYSRSSPRDVRLVEKLTALQSRAPEAAALIEQLVDDILEDYV